MKTRLLLFFVLAVSVFAQTSTPPPSLAPELAPIVAKHKADLAAVETQKKTALARAQHDYLAALDFADKAATSAGDLKGVVAIGKERDLAKTKPDLALSFPADLPEALRPGRKVYLDAINSANVDAKKREQQIDSDYLRTLGMLDSKTAANPALAQQIAAEKAEIIRRATGASSTAVATTNALSAPAIPGKPAAPATGGKPQATPAPALNEKLVNGNFEEADANGWPTGWKLHGTPKEGVIPDGVSAKAVKENGISFLRMTFDGRFNRCDIKQDVAIPNRARTATVKIWYRSKISGMAKPSSKDVTDWPYIRADFYDENGQRVGPNGISTVGLKHQTSFKTLEATSGIPSGAVKLDFGIQIWNCNGVFDFEHAEVIFK